MNFYVRLGRTREGQLASDYTLRVWDNLGNAVDVNTNPWSWVEKDAGIYLVTVPALTTYGTFDLYNTANPSVWIQGDIGPSAAPSTPNVPLPPGGGNTLSDNIARWRLYLDDTEEPYIWSNAELTSYCNYISNLLCSSMPVIEDSTSALTQITVVAGTHTYTTSERIVSIIHATLAGASDPLSCVSALVMDIEAPGWRVSTSTSETPDVLVTQGLGNNTVRIYPIPALSGTLQLTVRRLPSTDLVYATHAASSIEIPAQYSHLLDNGVYWKAYGKQDADSKDLLKMRDHERMWRKDFEDAKRAFLVRSSSTEVIVPLYGNI